MQAVSEYKLKVVGGLHKDAELDIKPDIRYSIGSGEECDIILLDGGVEKQHLYFSFSQGEIRLEEAKANVFIDGKSLLKGSCLLSHFQIITIGAAHFAFGPCKDVWPDMEPMVLENDTPYCTVRDLVPVAPACQRSQKKKGGGRFKLAMQAFSDWIAQANKKPLLAAVAFLFALTLFTFDTWLTFASPETMEEKTEFRYGNAPLQRNSALLAMVDGLMRIGNGTFLVGTGIAEPDIPVETESVNAGELPVDQIRKALRKTWGEKLSEAHNDDKTIYFKGFDEQDRQDLDMEITRDGQGQVYATATTLTKRKKKKLLSQMGDTTRIAINAAEDMENVCKRVLQKNGIRKARATYDMDEKAMSLNGETDEPDTISAIADIVTKAFPAVKVDNHVKRNAADTKIEELDICSVSMGGIPHVIGKDGAKIFKGGKLKNGCTLVNIQKNYLMLNCEGSMRKHRL